MVLKRHLCAWITRNAYSKYCYRKRDFASEEGAILIDASGITCKSLLALLSEKLNQSFR